MLDPTVTVFAEAVSTVDVGKADDPMRHDVMLNKAKSRRSGNRSEDMHTPELLGDTNCGEHLP